MPKSVQRLCWLAVADQVFPFSKMGSIEKEYLEECSSLSKAFVQIQIQFHILVFTVARYLFCLDISLLLRVPNKAQENISYFQIE